VTNERKLGRLIVTKSIIWNGIAPNLDTTFSITIAGPSYPGGNTKTINTSGNLTWDNLIPGNYIVTEGPLGSEWKIPVITGSPATIPPSNGDVHAAVTNERKLGGLKVTKSIIWNGVAPNINTTFAITITGPTYPAGNTKTLNTSGNLTWTDLIPGNYIITEGSLGVEWKVPVIDGSPAIVPANGGQAPATITNEMKTGEIIILKKDINTHEIITKPGVTFSVNPNPYATIPPVLTVTDNDSHDSNPNLGVIQLKNVPLGSYTITETAAPAGYAIDPIPQIITTNPVAAVTVESNDRPLSRLEIVKFLDTNKNGIKDDNEHFLEGWQYTITGPGGYNSEGTTNTIGLIVRENLAEGEYTITEKLKAHWELTTPPNPKKVTLPVGGTVRVMFGNSPVPVPAASNLSLGILIAGISGAMIYFIIGRRMKKQNRTS